MKNEIKTVAVNFSNAAIAHVQFAEAHEDVKKELISHFEDNFQSAKNYGLSDSEAAADSLKTMGDATEIGQSLNQVHQAKIETTIIFCAGALCLVGLFALSTSDWLNLQIIWMMLGLALSFLAFKLSYKKLMTALVSLYPIALIGILSAQFFGISFEGQPFLSFLGLKVKIIDLASILFTVSMPAIIQKCGQGKWAGLVVCITILGPLFYFVVIGSVLPAILMLGGCLVALSHSQFSSWIASVVGIAGAVFITHVGGDAFILPEQLQVAMSSERHTDFVFFTLAQNSKFISIMTVASFVFFLVQILRISNSIKNNWLKSTAMTCATLFAIEILFGLISNFGFAPMFNTGINIPFLSYGGSLMVAHLLMVGVILSCIKRKSIQYFA